MTYSGSPSSARVATCFTVTSVGPLEKSGVFGGAGISTESAADFAAEPAAEVAAVIFAHPVSANAAVKATMVKRLIMWRRLPINRFVTYLTI